MDATRFDRTYCHQNEFSFILVFHARQLVSVGAKWVCHSFRVLTRGRAPQDGNTPLHIAVHEGKEDSVRYLLHTRADVNANNNVSRGRFHTRSFEGGFACLAAC